MRAVALGRWWEPIGSRLKYAVAFGERQMLKEPQKAQADVAAHVIKELAGGSQVVCLPGSSVPTAHVEEVPRALIESSRGGIVVLETFVDMQRAEKSAGPNTRRGWVLRDGEILRGPIQQLFSSKGNLSASVRRTPRLLTLADQIERGMAAGEKPDEFGRVFPMGDGTLGLLLLCGEFNAVYGGKPHCVEASFAAGGSAEHLKLDGLWRQLPSTVVVFNPTHTWTPLPSVAGKRKFLASKGAYIAPTNAHGGFGSKPTERRAGVVQLRQQPPELMRAGVDAKQGDFLRASLTLPKRPARSIVAGP